MKRNMNRRSADLWLEAGHARPASTRFERAREMIKPSPALCMLDAPTASEGMVSRFMSMLPNRYSATSARVPALARDIEMGQFEDAPSPIAIRVTSPSKFERPESPRSEDAHDDIEIQVAQRGRMSAGPMYIFSGSPT